MAVIEDGLSALLAAIGLQASAPGNVNVGAQHATLKPIPYGGLGHYRVNHRCAIVNAQAANSRLFEVRNPSATSLIIPTRLLVKWLQTGAHTALIEDSLDVFKVTGFTAVDTVNTVTPAASAKRATMAAAPGAALIRGVTVAGAAAGMITGSTMVKDGGSVGQLAKLLQVAAPAIADMAVADMLDDVNGTHPFVFAQNEGLIIENRVLLGAAAASSVYIDFSWAEVTLF
jgi:hypothetical protein